MPAYFNPNKPEDTFVPFKIKDFKLPYNITNETINTLLTSKKGNDPPEHMYL